MMLSKQTIRLMLAASAAAGLAAGQPAAAQFVTFGSAQTISAASDVSTSGTLVNAYTFGSSAVTVNGVAFAATPSNTGGGHLTISGADSEYGGFGYGNNVTDSRYQSLLTNGLYKNNSGTNTSIGFTQSSLTPGERYQVQYFVNDSRSNGVPRNETVSSAGGNTTTLSYNTTPNNDGQFTNGTFTAAGNTITITAVGNQSTQVNGLQFRDLGNAGAPLTFSAPTAIGTADATLGGQSGTIVSAADFGAGTQVVTLTGGQTIVFDGSGANASVIGGNGTFTGAFTGNTGNTNFNTVLNGANYDTSNPNGTKQITLSNLTAGKKYSVQIFALDDRGSQNSRPLTFSDFSGHTSTSFLTGANDYVIGTFTAASSYETFTENLPQNGNINALVLRDISAAPEPAEVATLSMIGLGLGGLLLKARKRKASAGLMGLS